MSLKWRKVTACLRRHSKGSTEAGSSKHPTKIRNYFACKTLVMMLAYFLLGCQHTNTAICLPDIIKRNHGNYSSIATAMSLGLLCNGILVPLALLSNRFPKRCILILGFGTIAGGIFYALLPFTRSVAAFGLVYFIIASSHQVIFGFVNPVLSTMWKDQVSFPMHIVSLGYASGTAVAPLISKSFISPGVNTTHVNESYHHKYDANVSSSSDSVENLLPVSHIEIPFAIIASFVVMIGLLFLLFDILERTCISIPEPDVEEIKSKKQGIKAIFINALSPKSWASGNFKFGFFMAAGFSLYVTCLRGHDGVIMNWAFSFVISSGLSFTKEGAAYLISLSGFFRLVSLGVSTLCSYCVDINVMLFVEVIGTAICFGLLSFSLNSQLSMWIYLCGYRLLASSMWPSGYAWINQYVKFTVGLNCWITLIPCIVDIGTDNLVGYLLQYVSMISMMYLCFGLATLTLAVVVVLKVYAGKCRHHFDNRDRKEKGDNHESSQINEKECFITETSAPDQPNKTHARLEQACDSTEGL